MKINFNNNIKGDKFFVNKVVVFIVEGGTDKRALENIFKKIYKYKQIHFEFTHGDITSDENINKSNIEIEIYKHVNSYLKDKKLKLTDIWQIVQIFDMDGTYIEDSCVVQGTSEQFIYSTKSISCKNVQRVINRNRHKKEMIDYLLTCDKIKGLQYRCYYLSSNLDHALYNKLNLDDEEKIKYADKFYEQFIGKEKAFIDYLNMEVVNGVPESFPLFWRYIKKGLHSLERHTNLNIYFKENPILQ